MALSPENVSIAMPKKRGRPRMYTKVRVDEQGNPITPEAAKPKKVLSDHELLTLVKSRFDVMARRTSAMARQHGRALIISGAPGVGKSFAIEGILGAAAARGDIRYKFFSGTMTAINFFRTAFRYRGPKDIIILDDTDSMFADEAALNLLKAATDTKPVRTLSYMSDSFSGAELGGEDGEGEEGDIPQQFVFEGRIIFITNLDFDAYIQAGSNKFSRNMEALMSRAPYLDLRIHGRRELALWIGHVLRTSKLLQADFAITDAKVNEILAYLVKHQARVRVLSLRSALQCAELMRDEPDTWQESADVLLLREVK